MAEQIGEPELARLSVFQHRFLRLQFLVCQRQFRWSANPVTSVRLFKPAAAAGLTGSECLEKGDHLMKCTGAAYVLWALCIFGLCGIHRFYAGKVLTGII